MTIPYHIILEALEKVTRFQRKLNSARYAQLNYPEFVADDPMGMKFSVLFSSHFPN